ncbi:hypothetical protein JBKA6_0418 [Ichthyobacterium seriolicida]|uniref:DoxX family protein n=1 Tax=Ichthyobacterium seriolicida TaxID=242600 RepID=A0A1J1DX47_9FLAO|nr:hypothetical protein JBKA6_0418 [Ichthyobacterium seriolicida]
MLFTLISALAIGIYIISFLPIKDFRPYSIGTDILKEIDRSEREDPDIYEMKWIYRVDGKDKVFSTEQEPWNIEGAEFVDRKRILIKKGYESPIKNFYLLSKEDKDLTSELLQRENLILITSYEPFEIEGETQKELIKWRDDFIKQGVEIYFLLPISTMGKASNSYTLDNLELYMDDTTLKTIIRANPGVILLNKGVIIGKWSLRDIKKAYDLTLKQ